MNTLCEERVLFVVNVQVREPIVVCSLLSKIAIVDGLACLVRSDISGAARAFVEVNVELGAQFSGELRR